MTNPSASKPMPNLPATFLSDSLKETKAAFNVKLDPLGMTVPIFNAIMDWLRHPAELLEQQLKLFERLMTLNWQTGRRMMDLPYQEMVAPHDDDVRFADPVWKESPQWNYFMQWYLLWTRTSQDMIYSAPGLDAKNQRRAAFWWRVFLNAAAPTNFLVTNPVAQRKMLESRGESLAKGVKNFWQDFTAGTIRMTDMDAFKVGENLATTAGAVIFRNALMEVIHYEPIAKKVHRVPIVIVPPWINKFYILDLNPKKSMVQYLLQQGFDVYIASWKNPGAEMRNTTFDDYVLQGVGQIIEVARAISGSEKVNAVGYCIGGTALSIYMAWANRKFGADKVPVSHWTLFATLVDFAKPGDIEIFFDQSSVNWINQQTNIKGYFDGAAMAWSFRLLRPNSLIWSYVVNGYLYGEEPSAFDVLYWNTDSTRMPHATHAYYLEQICLHNRLVQHDALVIGGERINLAQIKQPLYSVSAADDHIAPWRRAFRIHFHTSGPRRQVLSSSGHILGIVNPPVTPPKRSYWVSDVQEKDNWQRWHAHAEEKNGSWWEDWVVWMKSHSVDEGTAPAIDSEKYPALAQAPGVYVHEK